MFTSLAQGNVFGLPQPASKAGRTFSAASVSENRVREIREYSAASAEQVHDLTYYLKGALAGGICCSFTHGALCPVDVVKTRIQLEPEVYNRGMIGGFRQVIAAEGVGALATGLGPTVVGYFVQGWFKFGGVEFFKINFVDALGVARAWELKTPIYLASAAMAEFIADLFLCPLEATRIRLVSDPTFAKGLGDGAARLVKEEGFVRGFYSGLGPILLKQIPYTMAKFAVQGAAADMIYGSLGKKASDMTSGENLSVSLLSGTIAGVAAAIISHPADTLLSKINKKGAGGEGGILTRLGRLASEIGFVKLATVGLGPRCVMIGSLTALQFAIFDVVMEATGASKFRFQNPNDAK
jgi:solute carrier family 25 phosphate transporter 3